MTEHDPWLAMVLSMANAPALVKLQLCDFTVEEGVVHFHGLVYVLNNNEVKCMVLQLYNDSIPAGYLGWVNTLALITQNYYWPHMSEFM